MAQYRKKTNIPNIEAIQYTGDWNLILEWLRGLAEDDGTFKLPYGCTPPVMNENNAIVIYTLDGVVSVKPFDWIVRDYKSEFYPISADTFNALYEPV